MVDPASIWPQSLAHLTAPYDDGVSDHIVIAEVSKRQHAGFPGFRNMTTALIPLEQVDETLSSMGGIGWEVKSWGPGPCVNEGQTYETSFWIDGRKGIDEKFHALINSWKYHDKEVLLPENSLLMAYGLIPRTLYNGRICWDDPSAPVYEVLRVDSLVDWNNNQVEPYGKVEIRREYLEDYCYLKRCAAVAVFYEERHSKNDPIFHEVLGDREGEMFSLPGRELTLSVLSDEYHREAPQFARIWGSRLILKPQGKPITEVGDPELEWPDYDGPMTLARASRDWIYGYVEDSVLQEYENKPEFSIHPISGAVSYGGWWGVSYCNRMGRNHIKVELKKLYEEGSVRNSVSIH